MVESPKRSSTSIHLDKPALSLAAELKKVHAAGSFSEYVRGLIALDGLLTRGPLDITLVPAWVIIAFRLDVSAGKVQPIRKA
jgi:hypothetical protein